jgi:hypothetical protein
MIHHDTDRRREAESKEEHDLKNAPNYTVLCMKGLTSPVWTLGMFQMVTGDSCQCMKRTKQNTVDEYPDVVRMWRQFQWMPWISRRDNRNEYQISDL